MEPAIKVENLGKEFVIGGLLYPENFRERLSRFFLSPLNRYKELSGSVQASQRFTALKDISFEIPPGEILGIIGANGAGKSTLLKILSRITPPTFGRVEILGKIGSLLEVGTGFNHELTGRENIYLNGAILGMQRKEIALQFDAIVNFAGVEQFIDTPVKRYSSGMFVRLAFAVAAHLRVDTLLVDEVLSVGDQDFQKKCLGKMNEVSQDGRTVVFVSHNLPVIENLCERVIVLDQGRIALDGTSAEAVSHYAKGSPQIGNPLDLTQKERLAGYETILTRIRVADSTKNESLTLDSQKPMLIDIDFDFQKERVSSNIGLSVETAIGLKIFTVSTEQNGLEGQGLPTRGRLRCEIPALLLIPGLYFISIGCGERGRPLDGLERVMSFEVKQEDVYGSGIIYSSKYGHMALPARFHLLEESHGNL